MAERSRLRPGLTLVLMGAIAITFLSTLTHNHTEAEDSLHYLALIDHGSRQDLFSRDHLVYLALNRELLDVWRALGYEGRAELPVRVLNLLASMAALALLYALLGRLKVSAGLRVLTVCGVAFSYAYWLYTGQCETYVAPVPFILGSVYLLIRTAEDRSSAALVYCIAAFSAAAILLHRQHILLVAVVVAGYILMFIRGRAAITVGRLMRSILAYAVTCGGIVLPAYLIVAVTVRGLHGYHAISGWIFGQGFASIGHFGIKSLVAAAAGLSRAVLSNHFLFSFPKVASAVGRAFPGQSLREEIFLVRNFPRWESLGLAAMTALLAICVVSLFVYAVRKRAFGVLFGSQKNPSISMFAGGVLLIYLVAYGAFNMYWEPINPEFWISTLPILGGICALVLNKIFENRFVRVVAGLFVILVFGVNLFGGILPQMDPGNDYWLVFNRWEIHSLRQGDLLVSGSGYLSKGYIEYYSGATMFDTAVPLAEAELWRRYLDTVERVKPERIFVSSTLLSPTPEYLSQFGLGAAASAAIFERLKPFLTPAYSDSMETIYLYMRGDLAPAP